MASKMEEILEQLEQVDKDLGESITVKSAKWIIENGKRVKKSETTMEHEQVEDAKAFIDSIIKEDINGNTIKTEEDLNKVKESIDKIFKTLENMSKNEELEKDLNEKLKDGRTKKDILESVVAMVKPVQDDLTKKQKAIEEYAIKGYDVNEHILYEQTKLKQLQNSDKRIDDNLDTVYKASSIFEDEFDKYNNIIKKEEKINELEKLYTELKQLKDSAKKETDTDKQAEILKKVQVKRLEIEKIQDEYKDNIDNDVEFPKNPSEIDKDGLNKISDLAKKIADEKDQTETKFKNKMKNLSPTDKTALKDFCDNFGIKETDLIGKENIVDVHKILSDKEKELTNKKLLNGKKIQTRQQTIDSFEKLEKVKLEHETLENESDENILKQNTAIKNVQKSVDEELTKSNLMDPSNIKRKDLRNALKTSVYQGKKFAGIRSFVLSISKKRALNIITETYRKKASKEYVDYVRTTKKKEYENEVGKRKTFAEQYKVIGIENTINGRNNKTETFDRLDEKINKDERNL